MSGSLKGAGLTLYGNVLSQPSRAVMWVLAMKGVNYKLVNINPMKGEADTDEYYAKFPQGGVPAMEIHSNNGSEGKEGEVVLRLTEAGSILPYLCDVNGWDDLYPRLPPPVAVSTESSGRDAEGAQQTPEVRSVLRKRAEIDQWMHWHHGNTRKATTMLMRPQVKQLLAGRGITLPEKKQLQVNKAMTETLTIMTHGAFLRPATAPSVVAGGNSPPAPKSTAATVPHRLYLVGDTPTLADITLYCELDQLEAMQSYPDLAAFPEVVAWMNRMKKLPEHDNIRKQLRALGYVARGLQGVHRVVSTLGSWFSSSRSKL